jgi:peroxin-4
MKEFKDAQSSTDEEIRLHPEENNVYDWKATLKGPKDTPYDGGVFQVHLRVPKEYPMVPPNASFETKIFHPNVLYNTGEICLDILKSSWSPAWTLQSVCRAILSLMSHPEPSSPLNCDAGNLLRCGDERGFNSLARMYTLTEASG